MKMSTGYIYCRSFLFLLVVCISIKQGLVHKIKTRDIEQKGFNTREEMLQKVEKLEDQALDWASVTDSQTTTSSVTTRRPPDFGNMVSRLQFRELKAIFGKPPLSQ